MKLKCPVLEQPVETQPVRTVVVPAPPVATETFPINPSIIALTVMLATFMEGLDTRVANVSLPHIAGNLVASLNETTGVLTAYLVSNAIVLPVAGSFSTCSAQAFSTCLCVATFTVASCLCGSAYSR